MVVTIIHVASPCGCVVWTSWTIYGETDDFSYNIVKDPVHIREIQATVLQQLGFDQERNTYRQLVLDQKLTGVDHAKIIQNLLA